MISILMPVFNGIEFIDQSVQSVLTQTYQNWELIIGVNGHNHNSNVFKIAQAYENNKIIVLDLYTITGKSAALNEMLKYAKYNYIALLDVDDIWNNKKLEIQSHYMNKYDVIGSQCIWFGEKPGVIPKIPIGDISKFDFTIVNPIINSSALIKKNLCYWKNSNVEDYELWLHLNKLKKKFYNCNEILVLHRIHSNSYFNNNNHIDALNLIKEYK